MITPGTFFFMFLGISGVLTGLAFLTLLRALATNQVPIVAAVHGNAASADRVAELLPEFYLNENDCYTFFNNLGDLIRTGPTNTNVMDVRLALIDFGMTARLSLTMRDAATRLAGASAAPASSRATPR